MPRVGIITDSTSDIPRSIAGELGIEVVPLRVFFGRLEFRDGIDLTADEFHARLRETRAHVSTSMPSPTDFIDVYKLMAKKYSTLISIHLSSELSGTVGSARMAAREVADIDVRVVDSKTVSMALLAQVIGAARMAREDSEPDEIIEAIDYVRESTEIYIVLDSLEYLQQGGRIGSSAAFWGELLGVKPVLTVRDGVIFPWTRVRSKKKAFHRIIDMIRARKAENPESRLWVAMGHGADSRDSMALAKTLKAEFNPDELVFTRVGPTLATHTGPGVNVVAFFLE